MCYSRILNILRDRRALGVWRLEEQILLETNLESIVLMQFDGVKSYALTMDALQKCTHTANGLGLAELSCVILTTVRFIAWPTIYNEGIISESTTGVIEGQFLQMFWRY